MDTSIKTLGRYEVLGELGRGACGVVYSAVDSRIGRKVAIKTIHSEFDRGAADTFRERLRREARSAGILTHPNIVTVYELDEIETLTFIVMEFVEGQTLAQTMQSGPLPVEFALSALQQTADALDFAHSHGIIHRDVKPANIMVTKGGIAKVTDFGIAKVLNSDSSLTKTGMAMGTVYYMPPEQLRDEELDGRADQFALGVVAYEMLAGRRPFEAGSLGAVLTQILSSEPPAVKQYRASLGDAVTSSLQKALAKNKAERYSSCREFVNELARAVAMPVEQAAPASDATALKDPIPPVAEQLLGTLVPPPRRSAPDAPTIAMTVAVVAPTRSAPDAPTIAMTVVADRTVNAAAAIPTAPPEPAVALEPAAAPEPAGDSGATAMYVGPGSPEPSGEPSPRSKSTLMFAAAGVLVVLLGAWLVFRPAPASKQPEASGPVSTQSSAPGTDAAPAAGAAAAPKKAPKADQTVTTPAVQAKQQPNAPAGKELPAYLFSTNPPGAEVTLDNDPAYACVSPCTLMLAPGRHVLVARLGGYRDAQKIIELPRDKDLVEDLVQMSGRLGLSSNPPGLSIVIDGQPQAQKTPASFTLPAGRHHIEFTKGSQKQELDVDVSDGSISSGQ